MDRPKGNTGNRRVVVLGVDGAPHSLVMRLVRDGRLPVFERLLREGELARMRTALPDVSSVAWTTFMTGKNPAKHNVYGFMDRCEGEYGLYFPNARDIRGGTLWDHLTRRNRPMVVINVPTTYPAPPVSGVLVSGFVAVDFERSVYPASLIPFLREQDYRIDVDFQKAHTDPDAFFKDLFETHDRRTRVILHLMQAQPWDLFMAVFTGTDRLQHFFWEHMEQGGDRFGRYFLEYYEQVDRSIGLILEEIGPDTPLIILSDHGFCHLKKELYINHCLRELGYLRFKKDPPDALTDIDPASRAYGLDPGRIYINLKGREPAGCVNPGTEYVQLCEELIRVFQGLKDEETGVPMVRRVWRREDLYQGAYFDRAPDLVIEPEPGYDPKGFMNRNTRTGRGVFTGMHTSDDAILYVRGHRIKPRAGGGPDRAGIPVISESPIHIVDVLPTILTLLGEPLPPELDGRVVI